MKKIYFMAMIATAALTMMSCSNDDITTGADFSKNETSGQAISFSTYLGRTPISRAAETQTGTDMGVYAYYTKDAVFGTTATPNFMFNQKIEKSESGDNWTYSPVKYWSNTPGEKISFFAYAPYQENTSKGIELSANNATGAPTAKITLQEPDNMVDFVAANAMNKEAANGTSVSFSMKHEMARAAFKATTDVETGTTVTIKSIKLSGTKLYKSGTYTFPTTDGAKGTWTPGDGSNSIEVPLTNKSLTSSANEITVYNYLFLIPVSSFAEGDVKATITYEIETTDTNLSTGKVTTSATKEIKLPARTLAQGSAYVYTFNIKLNQVTLTATADSWTDTANTLDVSAN